MTPFAQHYSDIRIVEAYRSGDIKVQQYWYDKCRAHFNMSRHRYRGLSEYNRDELFQDSFILLWEKIESGRIYVLDGRIRALSRNGDNPVLNLMRYFMGIVGLKYMEMLHDGDYMTEFKEEVAAGGDYMEQLYWDEDPEVEKDRIVSQCLLSLPKSCFEILTLFYYEQKTLEEILALRPENSTYNGLKSRKSKCISNLKERITKAFSKAGLR